MIETTTSADTWRSWCAEVSLDDVYWSWEHLALWANEWEDAEPIGVRWSHDATTVLHPVLRVPLDRLGREGLWDLRTAYDFAGPRLFGDPEAMHRFWADWHEHAVEMGVVTEFLRLHPTHLPALPPVAEPHADNYVVDLSVGYEAIRKSYHRSWRRNLRKSERNELVATVEAAPDSERVDAFIAMYDDAMDRLDAFFTYRFRDETLRRFLELPSARLLTVTDPSGRILAMATVLASESTLFYHLGCSIRTTPDLRPNHCLFDTLIRTGLDEGFETVHLGGGSKSLRRFKSQIANDTVPYSVVKHIHQYDRYAELCSAAGVDPEGAAFPAYLSGWAP